MNAPPIKVLRATWFYDPVCTFTFRLTECYLTVCQKYPLPYDLAAIIEDVFLKVKPWTSSYTLELSTAREIGLEGYAKLKQSLDSNYSVLFEDDSKAYLIRSELEII